jgi:lysophospholipase L1-like esterase
VVILYGTNDIGNIPGSYSLATFQTSYQNMLSAIISGMAAGTKIYCLGVLDRTGTNGGQGRTDVNGAISAAVTAVGNADTSYVSTDGWITPATDTGDGLHPNDTGAAKVATQLAAVIA